MPSVLWTCLGVHLGSRLWAINEKVRVRTRVMQSELTSSLCFLVLAQGLPTDPKMVEDTSWCTFCFACFLRLYVTNSARQKKKNINKNQLLPNLQQEVKGVVRVRGNTWSIIFWFVFLSVILKDQNRMLLSLFFMSP